MRRLSGNECFNAGQLARREGRPIAACPFVVSDENPGSGSQWLDWRHGWRDMHRQLDPEPQLPMFGTEADT